MVAKTKITDKDFKKVEGIIKAELAKRKDSQFRKDAERKWKEVDRQVNLTPVEVENADDWLNIFELGELAKASEIMTADILRVVFPEARTWFEAHVEMQSDLDVNTGNKNPKDKKTQHQLDGRLRAMMSQQHANFGLRERVELSVKEALHHGAFVAEIVEESMDMYLQGTSSKEVSAPAWKPHSLWNCYPDPSPSLVGSNMYYTGSMIIRSYMPKPKFIEMGTGDGWIPKAIKKLPKEEHNVKENRTNDLEIITYWGDVVIPKGEGMETSADDLYFPNYKAILANGKLVYLDAISTPYPPIVYKGYEKMDVRDPYYLSPIIKQSPMQKITTILANEFVNSVQLHARPPIVYDGNDPDFIVNGGPVIAPGAKTSTKGTSNFKTMEVGDPKAALSGVQFGIQTMKEALGRPGVQVGNRATAEEVVAKQADSESGPFGFAIKLDDALRTFLYMQHSMNLNKKDFKFSYYNPELDSPDFLRVERKDLPETVHFEVVGSKGILGEARRHQAFSQTTAFLSSNQMTAPLLDAVEVAKQMYMDAGVKSPERFLKQEDAVPPEIKMKIQQMMQQMQQLQAELKDEKTQNSIKVDKINKDYEAKMTKIQNQHQVDAGELQHKNQKLVADHMSNNDKRVQQLEKMITAFQHKMELRDAKNGATPVDNSTIDSQPTDETQTPVEDDMDKKVLDQLNVGIEHLSHLMEQQLQIQSETLQTLQKPKSVSIGGVQKDKSGRIIGATVNTTIQ